LAHLSEAIEVEIIFWGRAGIFIAAYAQQVTIVASGAACINDEK
jgi:hypothetical protein